MSAGHSMADRNRAGNGTGYEGIGYNDNTMTIQRYDMIIQHVTIQLYRGGNMI
jgi:hypothetical protein